MVARAVHFALTDEQASRLMDTPGMGNDDLLAFVEEIEEGPNGEGWDAEWTQETDKAWDAIHRCLTGGKLEWGDTPYHKCILGSDNLYDGDDYLMNYLDPEDVKAVAIDFIKQGIRANAICPGTIQTPSLDGRVADLSKSAHRPVEAVRQDFVGRQPMGRLGTAQEVAALAVFLASDEASYITGQAHLVDGGMTL